MNSTYEKTTSYPITGKLAQFSNYLKEFYHSHIQKDDRVLMLFLLVSLGLGLVYTLVNLLIYKYPGNVYISSLWIKVSPLVLALLIFSIAVQKISPRTAFFTKTFSLLFLTAAVGVVMETGFQFTPFPIIDQHLLQFDRYLGFNTLAVLDWTYSYPWFKNLLWYAYDSFYFQLIGIPFVLAFFMDKKSLNMLFVTWLIGFIIAANIYYFFPTVAPAGILQSPHFDVSQHATSLKFYQLHSHQMPTTDDGGMIAFPSCHVMWAILLTYACKRLKWLLYPLIPLNILMILATFLLGWHYLVDVFAAMGLAMLSIYVANLIYQRYILGEPSEPKVRSIKGKLKPEMIAST